MSRMTLGEGYAGIGEAGALASGPNLFIKLRQILALSLGGALVLIVTFGLATRPAGAAQTHAAWAGMTADGLLDTGSISGRVTNASGGAPIEGVSICSEIQIGNRSSGQCVRSDLYGEYTISDLASGSYTVKFSPGYPCITCTQQNYVTQYYNDAPSPANAQAVAVAAGSTTSGIDAQMAEGGEITGTVTNAAGGAPLDSIEVCALVGKEETRERCAITGPGGEYTLPGLASGSYTIQFSPPKQCSSPCPVQNSYLTQFYNGKASSSEGEGVGVTAGSTTSGIDAKLVEGGRITGRVTNASGGAPIEGIDVCARQTGGGSAGGCGSTNANGEYTDSTLAGASYSVEFFASEECTSACPAQNYITQFYSGRSSPAEAKAVPVSAEMTTSGIDAQMVEGGQITGRVTNASGGAAIEGIEACVLAGNDEVGDSCASTNANGEYAVSALTSGPYRVEFARGFGYKCDPNCPQQSYMIQYYNGESLLAEADAVPVTARKTTPGIDAQMVAGPERPTGAWWGPLVDATPPAPIVPIVPVVRPTTTPALSARFSLDGSAVTVQGGDEAAVRLSCVGTTTCAGRLTLTARVASRRGSEKHTKARTLARGAYSIPAGQTLTVKLKLNRTGSALLSAAHGRLGATLTILGTSPTPGGILVERVQVQKAHSDRK